MNTVVLSGRLTKDPDVKYTQSGQCVCNYTLAVDRRKDGTDFIPCVAFGKSGEFGEKYLKKGMKIMVTGRINTGSYKNKEGKTIFTFNVAVEGHEFCESRKQQTVDEFLSIPDNGMDEELIFR